MNDILLIRQKERFFRIELAFEGKKTIVCLRTNFKKQSGFFTEKTIFLNERTISLNEFLCFFGGG